MSKGPSTPVSDASTRGFVSGIDLTDEIRRHLRTLDIITKKGDGNMILGGRTVQVANSNSDYLKEDIKKALKEMQALSKFLEGEEGE